MTGARTIQWIVPSSLFVSALVVFSCRAGSADEYKPVDPGELSFELKGGSSRSVITKDGPKTVGGTVEELLCEGKSIHLASNKFDGEFLLTKDYGKIKIQFSPSLTSSGFTVWLTPKQKEALKALKSQSKPK